MAEILKCNELPTTMKIAVQTEINERKSAFIWIMGDKDYVYLSKADCLRLAKKLISIAEEIE